jgi:hypothetical protein
MDGSVWKYSDWLGEWVRDESLDHLMHDGSLPDAAKRLKHDLQTVLDWLGVKTVNEVGIAQRLQWAHAGEEHSRTGRGTPNPLGVRLTDEILSVFARMEEAQTDRFFVDDEASRLEQIARWRAAEVSSGSSINDQRNGKTPSPTSDSVSMVLGMKGIVGFASGFFLMFGLELLLFSGMELLSGHRLRAVGAGWIIMPIVVGCGGWILFREIDFSKVIGADRVLAEFRKWPREHKIALAIVAAIGWVSGVLIGYFVNLTSTPIYHHRTLWVWLFGSYDRFTVEVPWGSFLWGFVGGGIGAAIVFARQLLQSERPS